MLLQRKRLIWRFISIPTLRKFFEIFCTPTHIASLHSHLHDYTLAHTRTHTHTHTHTHTYIYIYIIIYRLGGKTIRLSTWVPPCWHHWPLLQAPLQLVPECPGPGQGRLDGQLCRQLPGELAQEEVVVAPLPLVPECPGR